MKARSLMAALVALSGTAAFVSAGPGVGAPPQTQCAPGAAMPAAMTPVAYWSTEARCAIVPCLSRYPRADGIPARARVSRIFLRRI